MDPNPYTSPYGSSVLARGPMIGSPTSELLGPLYAARRWIMILGVSMIVMGGLQCLTIIGIAFGWLAIWLGILLYQASKSLTLAVETGNPDIGRDAMKNLATAFTIQGILMVIGLALAALYIAAVVLFSIVAISSQI